MTSHVSYLMVEVNKENCGVEDAGGAKNRPSFGGIRLNFASGFPYIVLILFCSNCPVRASHSFKQSPPQDTGSSSKTSKHALLE